MYLNNGAGGYIVYRKAGKGKYSKLANINKNTILSYTDKSAKNGTVYTYKIVACKTAGKTSYNAADSNQKTIMRITRCSHASGQNSGWRLRCPPGYSSSPRHFPCPASGIPG